MVTDVRGALGARIHEIQRAYDPKLANYLPPHVTLAGSSGVGPITPDTDRRTLRTIMEEIAATTPPLVLPFGKPLRFMQTDIVVLPLDPHGALRELHDRIVRSGLSFQPARHAFTPHVTLSFFRTLTPEQRRALLAIRIDEPFVLDHLRCSLTDEPLPPREIFEVPLSGTR